MSLLTVLCALGGASLAFFVVPAAAAGLSPAVEDCNSHGQLTRRYTIAELRSALNTMPVDVKEYTNCADVIQQALLADLGKLKPGQGSGGGSFLPTWLIVVLALLVVGGAGFGVYAWRQRGSARPDG